MITGRVTAAREAVLSLIVYDVNGQTQSVSIIIDTGFTGWLTMPPALIAALGLAWKRSAYAILADGSTILTNVYEVVAEWDGQTITIPVTEADADPLIGMSLMYGYDIFIQNVDGGIVTLQRTATP